MAEKTLVEKAGETVGFGIAMASDVAGSIKTAIDAAVTTVTEVLKKTPEKKAAVKKAASKALAKKAANKAIVKKATRKTPAKKAIKKVPVKNAPAKKTLKKSSKKAARRQ